MNPSSTVRISEFPVQSTTRNHLARVLFSAIEENRKIALFFANTNFVVKCRRILSQLQDQSSVILVNDGIGMDLAAVLTHGGRFKENLNGTDFTPYLFQQSAAPLRVFMLGARPDILRLAVAHARERLGQDVVGSCDGYAGMDDSAALIERINQARPQVILVAMGNPMQEEWILSHRARLDANVMIGVGALFDFWSGAKPRAPEIVQRLRLEWLYRLCLEPRRLAKRYTLDILVFLGHCFKYR